MDKKFENFSKKLTRWIGSSQSVVVHTIFFVAMFCLRFLGISASNVLLILTTIVSLEAIYLCIFIQITVNQQGKELEEVSEDIEEIQKDVEEISEDVEEIQEDVEEISEDDERELKEEQLEVDKLKHIEDTLQSLLKEISELTENKKL